MKKIYICHEFGGIYENAKKVVDYIEQLVTYNKNAAYISPILTFGCLTDKIDYTLIMDYSLSILQDCDLMITFGDESLSRGCIIEKNYCNDHNIPMIDFVDYCKKYFKD